ncbi:MAG: hypothetical protein Q4D98_11390 [Planctomycetia bacterium]|nr:hypothetical protein [Planctomycetia bacterium]
MRLAVWWKLLLSGVVFLACGCSDGRPRCYPVSGTIEVDGKPLSGKLDGTVRFVTVDTQGEYGRPATGHLDENGRFSLTSYEQNDGCPKGTYKVELQILETRGKQLYYVVPPRYESAAQSDLQVEITGKTEDLKLEVRWLPEDASFRAPIRGEDGAS